MDPRAADPDVILHWNFYYTIAVAMPDLKKLTARLEKHYGKPALPPARGPFEWVLWENACYLLSDERRAAVFEGLRAQVGLNAEALWKAPDDVLLPLAKLGGMRPETRVFRWREIARITREQFAGDLGQICAWPYAQALKALRQYPNIGGPGAEKILMFCGAAPGLPLESNGLRVLTRVGYGRVHLKNYGAMYKSVQEAIAGEVPGKAESVARTHLTLRRHGQGLCKTAAPQCVECPAADLCAFAGK
jgi:endonuclease-3